jgi:transposase
LGDVSRFEQFCQFRSLIRASKEHLIVGIDIAKDKHHAFFGTAYGKTLWRRLIFTDRGLRQVHRLNAIHQAAGQSVGLPVDASACYEARVLVERLKAVKDQIAQTMQKIEELCQSLAGYKLLLTIPGFGPYIAAMVLSALADPFRFSSRKQVIRLAGLDLNASRSGKKSADSVPVISKKGDADLRYALYQAALIASYHNDSIRRLYQRMLDGCQGERGIKTKARVKLAAKMLVIAWTMLKNNESFDERRLLAESGHGRRDLDLGRDNHGSADKSPT